MPSLVYGQGFWVWKTIEVVFELPWQLGPEFPLLGDVVAKSLLLSLSKESLSQHLSHNSEKPGGRCKFQVACKQIGRQVSGYC